MSFAISHAPYDNKGPKEENRPSGPKRNGPEEREEKKQEFEMRLISTLYQQPKKAEKKDDLPDHVTPA